MITTRAKRETPPLSLLPKGGFLPIRRTSPHLQRDGAPQEVPLDPAGLSAALRELAVLAHRAVRTTEVMQSSQGAVVGLVAGVGRELVEIHSRILLLHRSVQVHSLDG